MHCRHTVQFGKCHSLHVIPNREQPKNAQNFTGHPERSEGPRSF